MIVAVLLLLLLLLSYCMPLRLFERRGQRPQEREEELAEGVSPRPLIPTTLVLLVVVVLVVLVRVLVLLLI